MPLQDPDQTSDRRPSSAKVSRRSFLKQSAVWGAALSLSGTRVLGANSDIRLAVIGVGSTVKIGGKGRHDIADFRKIAGVRVVGVCDCDTAHLDWEVAQFKKWGEPVKAVTDFRRLLDDPDIDAISITTPNHWHSLMAVMACQAGKDVFVQKPMSHNLSEGRKVVEAMHRYRRIVQATHGPRNQGGVEPALAWIREGHLGKVLYVQGLNYRPRTSIGKVSSPQPIPPTCDYNLWCGPAPMKPLWREYLHYDWHWVWDTGNGDLGNMGIHFMDGCRWALGARQLCRRVMTVGARLGYDDDGETPNTLVTLLDYEPVPIIFEVRGLPKEARYLQTNWDRNANETMDRYMGMRLGVIVHCEGGTLRFGSRDCAAYDAQGKRIRTFTGPRVSTKQNFIDCVRSRKADQLYTDALEGHLSCGLMHMSNISVRLGRGAPPQTIQEQVLAEKCFQDAVDRMLAHLEANRIDLRKTPLQLGPVLTLDPETERFVGPFSAQANALATRDYRPPFVMPARV